MDIKYVFLAILLYIYHQLEKCNTEKITYISTEHPVITYFDKTYFKNVSLFNRRHSRQDPRYFVEVYLYTLKTLSNDITIEFYFYQFLTNRYRPSFVEMHFKFCDLVLKDTFFGIKRAVENISCPFVPGEYDLKNLYIHHVPQGFPFLKGRIYCNTSIEESGSTRLLVSGSIDMEVKVAKISKKAHLV